MSSAAAQRAAIVARIAAIADIGKVHDYERYAADTAAFSKLYKHTGADGEDRILGWFVKWTSRAEIDQDTGLVRLLTAWRITGFMSLSDEHESEKLFSDKVEAIAAAFRTERTLGGLVDDVKNLDTGFGEAGVQVDSIEPVLFNGVLCHRAMLRLVTDSTEPSVPP